MASVASPWASSVDTSSIFGKLRSLARSQKERWGLKVVGMRIDYLIGTRHESGCGS